MLRLEWDHLPPDRLVTVSGGASWDAGDDDGRYIAGAGAAASSSSSSGTRLRLLRKAKLWLMAWSLWVHAGAGAAMESDTTDTLMHARTHA